MAKFTRRQWLKGGLVIGGIAVFATSYRDVAKRAVDGLLDGSSGKVTLDRINGNSLLPEGKVTKNTTWQPNTEQAVCMTQCFGCWTQCGVRARVDRANNKVLRIAGNPYHPLSHDHHFAYNMPIKTAFEKMGGESGLEHRSTACARGATMMESLDSPTRILEPMKRVGKRGEGKWKRISFEQLIHEVSEGGDLFGEGHVDGLRAIRDLETLIDPKQPSLGPKANQLLVTNAGDDGRDTFIRRFAQNAFGSKNFGAHGSYCGLAYRAGSGALMNDLDKNAHVKPDWDYVEFALFLGTSPAQSGNPFKRQARQLANARTRDSFHYAVVAPALPLTTTLANDHGHWIPVQPGTDAALVMGMIRWIIENQRYNAEYLSVPSEIAMENMGEKSWTNATHLVISDDKHPLSGQMLTTAHLTDVVEGKEQNLVLSIDGQLLPATQLDKAQLFAIDVVTLKSGESVTVKSSFQLLNEAAKRMTLAEYSERCKVPESTIIALAREFTAYGRKAAVISHGGMMGGNGFYTAWSVIMLNALIGNLNLKGGVSVGGGKFNGATDGPCYKMDSFKGKVKPQGMVLSRSKMAYEKSDEYRLRVENGEQPYPAKAPWYPFAAGQLTEQLGSALEGYPYSLKAWITNMTNPVYGVAGMRQVMETRLKDPKHLPLIIGIDAFMNETTALADYIVPDTHNFESWGFSAPWSGVQVKASTARWPIVEPRVAKTSEGQPISMETFCIAVAKVLNLPGFGDDAIEDMEGNFYPINSAEDYYLRVAANMAFIGEKPVSIATNEDILLSGVDAILPKIKSTLKKEEVLRVAYIYTRGGRFAPYEKAWDGDKTGPQWKKPLQIWNEEVAKNHHAITGERYSGCPTYYPPRLSNGSDIHEFYPQKQWPLKLMSFKSHMISSSTGMIPRLRMVKPTNLVAINPLDGQKWGINHGDKVRIITPGGQVEAEISLLSGVMPGVLAIEHGYGHHELGARQHYLDERPLSVDKSIGNGINLNDLGFADPTRAVANTWLDWVSGAAVRQGLPAKIERIA
ncbi:tetrathionate reductase subunit TtrA [Proteus myxofaciens]|uniref:Tetrathionate reductase subunit A n=1 Tax=Proteus myxofaciens ATCC 19692 TaxID=1354337 RepID=A0A198GFT7_9GAMM|nr:tetrathionate reductase subunit TtrA [Proteus myxofaciens]OAT36307.1 tetrathionate reductase subunit A [Proteus myxofaciens ATCC 19692]